MPLLMLADNSPFFFQQLILGDDPSVVLRILYSFTIIATVFAGLVSLIAMFSIWWERKVAGHIQSRIGPNRVGPIGLFQSLADGIKLLLKEDLMPGESDKVLFRLAPYLAFAPAFAAFLALPFAPFLVFEPRLNVGVFWILAVLSVEVMGVILAGWASNNKWSLYGSMREACQIVS
jgi:NADH-quinone oxidoreductase subunit H